MSEENKTLIYTELLSGTVGGYVTDYSQIKNTPTLDVILVTTLELYEIQMSNGLIPNKSYLIYDHVTYIDNLIVPAGMNRTSNLIPFDIIVTASSKNTLCEDAIIKSHDYNYESLFSDYCNMLGFSGRYNYDQYSIKGKLVKSDFPVMYLFDSGQIFQYFKKLTVTINGKDVYTNIYVDYFSDHANILYICIIDDVVYFSLDLSNWYIPPFGIVEFKNHYYDITYMKDDRGNQYTYDAINKLIVENGFIRATFYDYVTNGTNVALFFNQYTRNNNIDKDAAIYVYYVNYDNNVIKNNFISTGLIQAQLLNINECFEGIFRMEAREYTALYNISISGRSYLTDDLYIPLVSNKQYYLSPETNTLTENNPNTIIEVTYDLLLEMAQNYKLTPEAEYLITDYVTTLEEGVFETGHLSNTDFPVRNDYLKMDILVKAKDSGSLYSEGKALPVKYKSNFGSNSIREPLDILYDIRNQNSNVIYGIVLDDKKVFYFLPSSGGYTTNESELIIGKYITDKTNVGTRITYIDIKGLEYDGTITDILTPKGAILWMKDLRGNEAPYDFMSNSFYIDSLSSLRPGYYYTFTGTDGSNKYNSSLYQNIKIKQDFIPLQAHSGIIPSIFTDDYGPQFNINVGYYSYVIAVGNLTNVNIYPDTYVLVEDCTLNNVDILFSNKGAIAHVLEDYTNVSLQASLEGLIVQDKINIKKELPIIELLSTSSIIEIDNPANFLVGDRVTFKVKQSHRVDKVNNTSRGQYTFRVTLEANSVNNGIIAYPGLNCTFYIEIPMENPATRLLVGTIFDAIVELRNGQLYFVAIGTELSYYSNASTSTNGLMSSSDKTKLDTYPATYTEVTSYTDTAIANLVDSAPETLNTLNELAVAIQDNEDVVEALNQSIGSKQDKLISGTNIKTVNGQSLLGNGDLEIQEFKTYTFDYNNHNGTITQEELNKVLEADNIYIKDNDTLVNVTVKDESDTLLSLKGDANSINFVKEYNITIDKIGLTCIIYRDDVTLLIESDLEDLTSSINYKEVDCPYIEDGLVLEEQYINFDPSKITILKVIDSESFKIFYLRSNAIDVNATDFNYSTIIFYGKYTDTSLLKATYNQENQTLTFNIIEQSGGSTDLSNYYTKEEANTAFDAAGSATAKLQEAKDYTDTKTEELRDVVTQTLSLTSNYNWYSFYVDITLEQLQQAFGTNVTSITTSFDGTTEVTSSYDANTNTWSGDLTVLDVTKMYMINANTACEISLTGRKISNSTVYILNPGWNWIGYPLNQEVDINTALKGLDTTEGDKIKFRGSTFAEYYDGEWFPEDFIFKPGQGYMYQNTYTEAKTLVFTTELVDTKSELNKKQDVLVSGTNIKTVNGESVLGEGNINISGVKWSILKKEASNVGDIAYWNGISVKTIPLSSWDTSLGTPVGVVVIPNRLLPDGKARIMSLTNMIYNDDEYIVLDSLNEYEIDTPVVNHNVLALTDNEGSSLVGTDYYGYLPSDRTDDEWLNAIQSYDDPLAKYHEYADLFIPSPYLSDGSLNPAYAVELEGGNALSDFNGLSNTRLLVNEGEQYHAAHACWNYKDDANSNLQWYLPAIGELGFLMSRFELINNTLQRLSDMGVLSSIVDSDNEFWSSSEVFMSEDHYRSYNLLTYDGSIDSKIKDYECLIRSFAIL